MRAVNHKLIDVLNEVLTWELTAVNQYFLHAEMCGHWGYRRLYAIVRKHAIDEMRHAERLIERILFLDGLPNVQRLEKVRIGQTVPEQFRVDLELELAAVPRLNEGIAACREASDNGSRLLLEEILRSEEEHIEWLETQLGLLEQIGVQNYLGQQVKEDPAP